MSQLPKPIVYVIPSIELNMNHFIENNIKLFGTNKAKIIIQELKNCREMLKLDGLAAPQLGYVNYPIFVLRLRNDAGEFKKEEVITCINPKLLILSREVYNAVEKCASIPNVKFLVSRPKMIIVSFYDLNATKHEVEFHGTDAGMWLHEYHHLLGVTLDQVGLQISV